MRSHDTDANGRPTPRGGWFAPDNTASRRRAVQWANWLGIFAGIATTVGGLVYLYATCPSPQEAGLYGLLGVGVIVAAPLPFLIIQSAALVVTGINWRDLRHDIGVPETWAALLEIALFCASMALQLYSLIDAVKYGSLHSAIVLALLVAMTWWPFIRHRIRHGRWPG